jgi:hypothetical protein
MTTKTLTRKSRKQSHKTATPKAQATNPTVIECTRLFSRDMSKQFPKGSEAMTYMAVNDDEGTYCFCNAFHGALPLSYDQKTYTFKINPRKLAQRIEAMEQVEPADFPAFVRMLPAKKSKK